MAQDKKHTCKILSLDVGMGQYGVPPQNQHIAKTTAEYTHGSVHASVAVIDHRLFEGVPTLWMYYRPLEK